jgi:hypothetical protein
MLTAKIAAYNAPSPYTARYNQQYKNYIAARNAGIVADGSLGAWIAEGGAAAAIQALLTAFVASGQRKSRLASISCAGSNSRDNWDSQGDR